MRKFVGAPIFICGFQRAGTRSIVSTLGRHPGIIPATEINFAVVRQIHTLVEFLDKTFATKSGRGEGWLESRQDYFLNAIANTYTPSCQDAGEGRPRFMNKTPRIELAYKEIVACCSDVPPQFVFCARHPLKVLKSLANMPWNKGRDAVTNAGRLATSVKNLERMQADGVSVLPVFIDRISEDRDERIAFYARIFDFLGADYPAEVQEAAGEWLVAQPTEKVVTDSPKVDLTGADRNRLRQDDAYRYCCRVLGYDPEAGL